MGGRAGLSARTNRRRGLSQPNSPQCANSRMVLSKQMAVTTRRSLFALALSLVAASAGIKERAWQTGTLLDVSVNSVASVQGVNGIINTARVNFWSYTLDAGDRVYVGERRSRKPVQLEINGPIQFAVEKDHIFILDHERRELRLNIIKTTLKTR